MNTATQIVTCVCCKEPILTAIMQDKDLGGPLDEDCYSKLKWAQAQLKLASIAGCANPKRN